MLGALLTAAVGQTAMAAPTPTFTEVSSGRARDIIAVLCAQDRRNYERIRTWEGTLQLRIMRYFYGDAAAAELRGKHKIAASAPSVLVVRRTANVSFAADLQRGLLFSKIWCEAPDELLDGETGVVLPFSVPEVWQQTVAVTPEYSIRFLPNANMGPAIWDPGGRSRRAAIRDVPEKAVAFMDPQDMLQYGYKPLWKTLERLDKVFGGAMRLVHLGRRLRLERARGGSSGQLYRLVWPSMLSADRWVTKKMLFSGEAGLHIVSAEVVWEDGSPHQTKKWEYRLVGNVRVPTKVRRENFNGKTKKLTRVTEWEEVDFVVNRPIPSETFTYRNFGLQNGDRFVDKLEGKEYAYKDGELVFAGPKDAAVFEDVGDQTLDDPASIAPLEEAGGSTARDPVSRPRLVKEPTLERGNAVVANSQRTEGGSARQWPKLGLVLLVAGSLLVMGSLLFFRKRAGRR